MAPRKPIQLNRRMFVGAGAAGLCLGSTARAAPEVRMDKLYHEDDGILPLAHELDGQRIEITGFMAPPLRAGVRFFVLAEQPMSVCPFCDETANWPGGIVPVYTNRSFRVAPFWKRIGVAGELVVEDFVDPDTGFASPMRIAKAVIQG
ncbi:MAG: hypothetical protein AAFQ59_09880 [Pseudomonadota bacterium]